MEEEMYYIPVDLPVRSHTNTPMDLSSPLTNWVSLVYGVCCHTCCPWWLVHYLPSVTVDRWYSYLYYTFWMNVDCYVPFNTLRKLSMITVGFLLISISLFFLVKSSILILPDFSFSTFWLLNIFDDSFWIFTFIPLIFYYLALYPNTMTTSFVQPVFRSAFTSIVSKNVW